MGNLLRTDQHAEIEKQTDSDEQPSTGNYQNLQTVV